MFFSKIIIVASLLFFVIACSSNSYYGMSPVTTSDISYYKGRYTITLETNHNLYDMYINYDSSVQYKLSTDKSYTTISKSSIKYNSQSNFFSFPLKNNDNNTFELKFKDKNNINVKLLDDNNKVVDVGVGEKA